MAEKTIEEVLEYIDEEIECELANLKRLREAKISMNSCGAGYIQGSLETLDYMKKFILEGTDGK